MKNRTLTNLLSGINAIGHLRGIKFSYAMAKNKKRIIEELELLGSLVKFPEEFEKYEKKRLELCEEHSKKDENNKPILVDQGYVIADMKKFNDEHKKLKGTFNKKIFENREQQIKEFNEFSEKESSFEPFKIKKEDVPEDITVNELSGIFELINDEEIKIKKK